MSTLKDRKRKEPVCCLCVLDMTCYPSYDPRLQVPGKMQIAGPSLCGKTTWLYHLLKDTPVYFRRPDGSPCHFQKMVYCYGSQWQPIFDDFKRLGVVYHQGLPEDLETLFPPWARPGLLILDDLMLEVAQSPQVTQLLTRSTHHMDLFAITLMQNLHTGGRQQTTQNRNYHYTVLFRNPADTRYVKALGNRWMGDSRGFWELYKKATEQPYGYLLIDNHPRTDEAIRFRTHLLVDDPQPITVLQPVTR